MKLKSIHINEDNEILIQTDEGTKKILQGNPLYIPFRTQLETITFQAYGYEDKRDKYYKPVGNQRDEQTYFDDQWNFQNKGA